MSTAADLANRALAAAGSKHRLGDIEQGGDVAEIVRDHYDPVLRQLLTAAHWNFARAQKPMLLLGDATGSTPNVGTLVQQPWTYVYALPTDCMRARFVPQSNGLTGSAAPPGNITPANPTSPLFASGNSPASNQMRLVPARFLVGTDPNYAPQLNLGPGGTEWWNQVGISPSARSVVMTNVNQASLVYTCYQPYPSLWDALFEEAFVACLAERLALPLAKDDKFGMTLRKDNMLRAQQAIASARISDGNEGWTSADNIPDWIRIRSAGGGRSQGLLGGGWDGPGNLWLGWGSYLFSNGSAF